MISLSIRRKIMGIAVVLIVLMAVTAVLSMASVMQVGDRLDELTRSYIPAYGGRILVSEATVASASDAVESREIDRVAVLGQNRSQAVFEIMGRKDELLAAQVELRNRFSEGLASYRSRRWDEARHAFGAALTIVPDDGPSTTFMKRLDKLILHPPGEDWDGAWRLEQK